MGRKVESKRPSLQRSLKQRSLKQRSLKQRSLKQRSLNIKDPEVHRLAKAIASVTGESLTGAVTEALRERYERLKRGDPERIVADIRAIARRAAAHVKRPYVGHAEFLYDERGLPK